MKQHHNHKKEHKTFVDKAKDFYFDNYKKLFIVPLVLFVLSGLILLSTYLSTGDFIRRDVSLKGGISLSINGYNDGLESYLIDKFPDASFNFRTIGSKEGIIIEVSDIDQDSLMAAVNDKITLTKDNYNIESMGSALGESFFKQMFIALIFAMVLMGVVFQVYFKNIYATLAAIFSAFMDIFITLGIMDLTGIKLTAGGIAAYLMLIGYSIDTSILLSTKLLKETTDMRKSLFGAMQTGLTMSVAGLVATGLSYLLTNNITLKQIMLILVIGLLIDIITTWIGNVAFLRYYLEKRK
jgi:preprotein translocase subunit SecF